MNFRSVRSAPEVLSVAALVLICGSALAQHPNPVPPPIRIVAGALELSESQVAELVQLRTAIQPEAEALSAQLRRLEQRLEQELATERPVVELVGELAVEISRTRRALAELHFSFVGSFAAGLEEDQRGRLQRIREAFQIREVLPAFQAVGLLP